MVKEATNIPVGGGNASICFLQLCPGLAQKFKQVLLTVTDVGSVPVKRLQIHDFSPCT